MSVQKILREKYLNKSLFDGEEITDIMLSLILNHTTEDESTVILKDDSGNNLQLCGFVKLVGEHTDYRGRDVFDLCETEEDIEKMIDYLHDSRKDSKYSDYAYDNNPWLEWVDEYGDCIGDVFDNIEESKEKELSVLNEMLV